MNQDTTFRCAGILIKTLYRPRCFIIISSQATGLNVATRPRFQIGNNIDWSGGKALVHVEFFETNMPEQIGEDITGLLFSKVRTGNREAFNQIVEELYPELRRVAAAQMRRERPGNTLQATALVHELYLELAKAGSMNAFQEDGPDHKRKFVGLAGFMMMRLLIHHARPLYRRVERLPLDAAAIAREPSIDNLAHVEDLLRRLESIHPDFRTVVELKVFEGCSIDEIASRLSCASRTVERRWHFAKHWLRRELSDGAAAE